MSSGSLAKCRVAVQGPVCTGVANPWPSMDDGGLDPRGGGARGLSPADASAWARDAAAQGIPSRILFPATGFAGFSSEPAGCPMAYLAAPNCVTLMHLDPTYHDVKYECVSHP